MKTTVELGEEDLAEAVRFYAEKKFSDRGVKAKAGNVTVRHTPGDRPFDSDSFSASVEVVID